MLRRCWCLLGATNRYTDGSGRKLDSSELPRELYTPPISNRAYPTQGEHWQPVVADEPIPHKGGIIVSGGGIVGMNVAALFALRGWHVTVVERCRSVLSDSTTSDASTLDNSISNAGVCGTFGGIEHALLTRRAADALESAGLRMGALRGCGVAVSGVMDHPGAYNSWLTRGLTEHHPFAVRMLSVDLLALRRILEAHLHTLPTGNCRIFHEHVVEAVYPLKQEIVVKPLSESRSLHMNPWEENSLNQKDSKIATTACKNTDADQGGNDHEVLRIKRQRPMETSLTLNRLKWERKFACDAVHYDLLVCAEGVNSRLRDLMDVEGFAADIDFSIRWFELRNSRLSHTHIHRWLHKRMSDATNHPARSVCQVPLAIAFPRLAEGTTDRFALMVYAPAADMEHLSGQEILQTFCPDLARERAGNEVTPTSKTAVPFPTIYCENLFNSVGLPSAVVVGDAAHSCNPFWFQGLAMGLEDGVNLLNQVDAYSKHFYDAIKQYSQERGCNGDGLREITDRCLYYERKKHVNPFLRFRNSYQKAMNTILPQFFNEYYSGASLNHVYSKSLEMMLNGRGYTSYEFAEKQQSKHRAYYHLGRVYT